jgi:hypothetical protein
VDKHGRTPLMIASAANLPVAINMILRNRSNIVETEVSNMRSRARTVSSEPANDDDDEQDLDDVTASINISDVEGNCCLHYAYATGAASAITALEAALLNSKTRAKEVLNFKQEAPVDCAGKISYMRPILPKVCNFYLKIPTKDISSCSSVDLSGAKSTTSASESARREPSDGSSHEASVPPPRVASSKIDFDDL